MKVKILWGLLLLLPMLFGCKEDLFVENGGDVFVTVYNSGSSSYYYNTPIPVKGATIFTVPGSKVGVTDQYGTLLLKGIPVGSYELYANVAGYGSGKTSLRVSKDSLHRTTVQLVEGLLLDIQPEITLISPALPANFAPGENIVFSLKVKDDKTPSDKIKVTVLSNLDGKLFEGISGQSGLVRFEKNSLTRGTHIITIIAKDGDGIESTKTFSLFTAAPGKIVLDTAVAAAGIVTLNWQKYAQSDFASYEIFRAANATETGSPIASFVDANTTTYQDKTPSIEPSLYYYVRVVNKYDQYRNSNRVLVDSPAGKIFYYSPQYAVIHPTEPIVYILDQASNKIKAINYNTNAEISSPVVSGSAGSFAVGDNGYGMEVYVPSSEGYIYIYDAKTLTLKTSILTGIKTTCVTTNGKGFLVASLVPSPWWEQPVRIYSRGNKGLISGASNGLFDNAILKFIPNTDNIISITRSVSPIDMDYIQINSSGSVTSTKDDSYHGDHSLDPMIFGISNNGEYLVTSSVGAVYSVPGMIYKGMVQRGMLSFSDYAFSPDGNTIYAGVSNNKSVQIIKYPELSLNGQIETKAYPKFIFYRNGEIIAISQNQSSSIYFVIEKLKL